jgi:putative MATE family efflux protein
MLMPLMRAMGMAENDRMKDLTTGPIPRHLATMSLQMGVGLLLQTLYFFVDLYFVAKLGDAAIAGVGAAGNLTFIVIALTQTLGVGTVALVSHAVGRKDRGEANHIFNQAVSMGALCAIGTLAAGWAFAGPYMRVFGADERTAREGVVFLYGYMPGMALQFATIVMASGLRGTGIVKPTMVVQALTVVANAALAPILITGWLTGHAFGAFGAGLATSLAVLFGVVLLAIYFVRLEHYVQFDVTQWKPRFATWGRMLHVGIPAGGEFFMIAVITAVMYWAVRPFGAEAQAGYGVGSRINQMIFVPAMAIAFSAAPIAGQNFGARNAARVRETFRLAAVCTMAAMAVLTAIVQWNPGMFARVFTQEPAVVAAAGEYLRYISWNFPTAGLVFSCSSLFQAMGNTWPSLGSSVLRVSLFAIPTLWMARQPWFEVHHAFMLSVATSIVGALVSYALLRREMRRRLSFNPAARPASPGLPQESRSRAA